MTRKSVLITGARGFIGSALARSVSKSGCRVAGLGHGAIPPKRQSRIGLSDWVNGDIEHANLQQLVSRTGSYDQIFHLAGASHVGRSFENPAEDFSRTVAAAGNLFEWIRLNCPDVPVVVVSSAAVYGAGHDGRIEEESELRPYSPYGSHKAMLESLAKSYCKNFGLKIAICRLFSVYGEGLEKQLIYDLCCKAENAEQNEDRTLELGGTGDELRDWVHVDDVCRLLETVMRQCDPSCPTFNGGRGQAISVREVAQSFSRAWGSDFQVQFNGRGRSGDPLSLVACPKRIQSLPFEFSIDLDRGLKRVVDYHRQQEAVG